MTEAALTRKMVEVLRSRGAFAVKIVGGPRQQRGLPDITGCYKGIFLGLEVKRPGRENTLTPIQSATLDKIRDAGGVARMVTTVAQVRAILTDLDARIDAEWLG